MNHTNVTLADASPSSNLRHSMPKGTIIGLAFVSTALALYILVCAWARGGDHAEARLAHELAKMSVAEREEEIQKLLDIHGEACCWGMCQGNMGKNRTSNSFFF
jgi:hypothetical protein